MGGVSHSESEDGGNSCSRPSLLKNRAIIRLLLVALLAEIGYATLNIASMPVFLSKDHGFGESVVGLVVTAYLLSEAIFRSPMGHFADRFGFRRFMLIGPCLTVCTSIISLLIPHNLGAWGAGIFVVLRIIDGLAASMFWPAAFALVGENVDDQDRQQAMSLMNSCFMIGIALAVPMGGVAESLANSYSAGLFVAAGCFVLVALGVLLFAPNDRDTRHEMHDGEGFQLSSLLACMRAAPAYLVLAVIVFMGIGFPMAIIRLFALDQFGMDGAKFGLLVLPSALAMAVLSVPMAKVGERLGRARAVHWGIGSCAAGLALISLGAFLPPFRHVVPLGLGGLAVGFGFLLAIPAWMASVSDIDPRKRAAYLGAVMAAQGIGAILGAPLGATMYEKLQVYGADFGRYSPFIGCAVCVTLGWIISLRILHDAPNATDKPDASEAQ